MVRKFSILDIDNNIKKYETIPQLDDIISRIKTSISVKNTDTQSISSNTNTLVTFPTEDYDTNNEFSNNTFTSKSNQTVLVSSYLEYPASIFSTNRSVYVKIYKNGTMVFKCGSATVSGSLSIVSAFISFPVKVLIGDTINIYALHTNSGSKDLNGSQVLTIESLY